MHEISPVLAGTFDAPSYAPARTNINPGDPSVSDTSSTAAIDSRRYTKWDHSAAQVGTDTTFSFSDFLDMINPLEHIPVLSSVYRAITNENINPVSRVAGDIMYGGAFGVASAVLGGLGAVADSVMEESTGHDTTGYVLASLFGTDDKKKDAVQVAQNTAAQAAAPVAAAAAVAPPAVAQAAPALAALKPPATTGTASDNSPAAIAALSASMDKPAAAEGLPLPSKDGKWFALKPKALPYGGVIAPTSAQAQNTAIALAEASHSMRLGNTIYTSPLMNGPHPMPIENKIVPAGAAAASTSSSVSPSASPAPVAASGTGPGGNPVPPNLADDMAMMKALSQYKGVAAGPAVTGSNLDLTN